MKRIMFFLAVIIFFATNLFSQVVTIKYNETLDRAEYYNDADSMVFYSIQYATGEVLFYNSNDQMLNPLYYNNGDKKIVKQDLTPKKKRFVLFENWRKDKHKYGTGIGSREYMGADGLIYFYDDGQLQRVRFYDICRDSDFFTPGP